MKKRLISLLLTLVMLVSMCSAITVSASADAQVATVTLASGDTVLGICQKYGIDYYTYKNLIMTLNGFTNESQFKSLSVGAKVVLPVSNTAAAALSKGTAASVGTAGTTVAAGTTVGTTTGTVSSLPSGDRVAYYLVTYTVQSGDTLTGIYSSIGLSYKTYQNEIVKLNKLRNINSIQVGKTLILPVTTPGISGTSYTTVMAHTMLNGESAYNIVCSDYGLNYNSVEAMLKSLNNRDNLGAFRAGETLYIPVAGVVSANTTVSGGASSTTGTVNSSAYYNLVTQTATNGSFDLQVGGKSVKTAMPGQTVSVVATPDNGYAVESIKVVKVGDASTSVAVSGTSFVMPSYSVTVSATFAKAKESKITLADVSNGNISLMVNNSVVSSASAGAQVTVKATPATGFMLDHVRVTYNDNRDTIAVENNKFTMPTFPVTVSATFKLDPDYDISKGNAIYFETENAKISAKVGTTEVTAAKPGDRVTLTVTPDEDYVLESVKVYRDDFKKTVNLEKMSFTMPAEGAVTVVAVVKPTSSAEFALSKVDNPDGTIKFLVDGKEVTSAKAGQKVTISGSSSKSYYNYRSTAYETGNSSNSILVSEDNTFTMPAFPVTVNVKFYVYHNIIIDGSNGTYGSYNVTAVINGMSVSRCGAGVELKVGVWGIKSGWAQGNIILTYADGSSYTLVDTNKFIMPDCDVRVRVDFQPSVKLVAHSIGDDTEVYTKWGNTYTVLGKTLNDKSNSPLSLTAGVNNKITVTGKAAVGYRLQNVFYRINNKQGENWQINANRISDTQFQFQMPSKTPDGSKLTRVDVFVTFEAIPNYSVTVNYGTDTPNGRLDLMTSLGYADHVAENSSVWVRPYPADGFRFVADNLVITDTVGHKITFNSYSNTFTMPAANVIIDASACFVEEQHRIFLYNNWEVDGSVISLKVAEGDVVYNDTPARDMWIDEAYSNLSVIIDKKGNELRFTEGTVVTVTHEAKAGSFIEKLDIKTSSGADVPYSSLGNGKFSFVMPLADVVILPVVSNDYYSIAPEEAAYGSFEIARQAKFGTGAEIKSVKTDAGYNISRFVVTYTDVNGIDRTEYVMRNEDGKYIVNPAYMPKTAVKVEAEFTAMKSGLQISYEFGSASLSETNSYKVDLYVDETKLDITRGAISAGKKDIDTVPAGVQAGKTVRIVEDTNNKDKRFEIDNVWVTYGKDDTAIDPKYTNGQYFFDMPYVDSAESCVIHVHYALADSATYKVNASGYYARLSINGGKSSVAPISASIATGELVTVTVEPTTDYTLSADTRATVRFTDADGVEQNCSLEPSTVTYENPEYATSAVTKLTYTFGNNSSTLAITATPKSDVEFLVNATSSAEYELIGSVSPDEEKYGDIEFYDADENPITDRKAHAGEKITVKGIRAKDNWGLMSLQLNGTFVEYTEYSAFIDGAEVMKYSYTFTMPEDKVVIVASYGEMKSYTVTNSTPDNLQLKYNSITGDSIEIPSDSKILSGTKIELVPKEIDGFTISGVYAAFLGTKYPIAPNSAGQYIFTIGSSDVEFSVEYTREPLKLTFDKANSSTDVNVKFYSDKECENEIYQIPAGNVVYVKATVTDAAKKNDRVISDIKWTISTDSKNERKVATEAVNVWYFTTDADKTGEIKVKVKSALRPYNVKFECTVDSAAVSIPAEDIWLTSDAKWEKKLGTSYVTWANPTFYFTYDHEKYQCLSFTATYTDKDDKTVEAKVDQAKNSISFDKTKIKAGSDIIVKANFKSVAAPVTTADTSASAPAAFALPLPDEASASTVTSTVTPTVPVTDPATISTPEAASSEGGLTVGG